MATIRTTISLDETDLKNLQALASKKGESLSGFLVSRGLGTNKLGTFDLNSLDSIKDYLISGQYPPTEIAKLEKCVGITNAVSDFQFAARIYGKDFSDALESQKFIPQLVPYPSSNKPDTIDFQIRLLSELSSLPDIGQRDTVGLDIPTDSADRNEIVTQNHFVRAGLVGSQPVAYLFPFFRPNNRRHLWGVIDYGRHRNIGILLHKDTFKDTIAKADFSSDMGKVPKNRAYTWLGNEVIETLFRNSNKGERHNIGFREGFFEAEIAEVIWSHAQNPRRFFAFEKFRFPYMADELKKILAGKDRRCGAIVVDLLESGTIEAHSDWQLVKFPHHTEVPVGIGFTLSLLPRLLLHNNWETLKKKAMQLIKENFGQILSQCGVQVNPE